MSGQIIPQKQLPSEAGEWRWGGLVVEIWSSWGQKHMYVITCLLRSKVRKGAIFFLDSFLLWQGLLSNEVCSGIQGLPALFYVLLVCQVSFCLVQAEPVEQCNLMQEIGEEVFGFGCYSKCYQPGTLIFPSFSYLRAEDICFCPDGLLEFLVAIHTGTLSFDRECGHVSVPSCLSHFSGPS